MSIEEIYSRRDIIRTFIGVSAGILVGCGKEVASTTPTHSPTEEQTVVDPTPIPTETATPTPTEVPEPEGSRGNVASVEELSIPEAQKEAIREILKGTKTMIIVEDEGDVVIIALDESMLAYEEPRICAKEDGSTQSCSVVKDIRLWLEQYPDADQKLVDMVLAGKHLAYITQSGDTISFNEFKSQRKSRDFEFQRRARNVFERANVSNTTTNDKAPVVLIVKDKLEDYTVSYSTAHWSDPLEGNGVIGEQMYFVNPGRLGDRDSRSAVPEDYDLVAELAWPIATWSDKTNLNAEGAGLRSDATSGQLNAWKEIVKHGIPVQNPNHWIGIFKVEGIPATQD